MSPGLQNYKRATSTASFVQQWVRLLPAWLEEPGSNQQHQEPNKRRSTSQGRGEFKTSGGLSHPHFMMFYVLPPCLLTRFKFNKKTTAERTLSGIFFLWGLDGFL